MLLNCRVNFKFSLLENECDLEWVLVSLPFSYFVYVFCFYFRVCLIFNLVINNEFLVNQVEASTNQLADPQMPVYNLPSKILCRVINVQLKVPCTSFTAI